MEVGDQRDVDAVLLGDVRHRLLAAGDDAGDERRLVAARFQAGGKVGDVQCRAAHVQAGDGAQDADWNVSGQDQSCPRLNFPEVLDGAAQAFLELDLRLVAEHLAGGASGRPPSRGCLRRAAAGALVSTGLPSRRPIVSATAFTLAGVPPATLKMRPLAPCASPAAIVAVDGVLDVGEVARLLAVAVDRHGLAGADRGDEERDHRGVLGATGSAAGRRR